MFFCSVCDNIYDITVKANNTNDDELTPTSVSESEENSTEIKNMSEKNNIDEQLVAYYICDNCGNREPLPEDTVLVTKSTKNNIHDNYDKKRCGDIINIKTLPITRNYVCPNDKCLSQKDHSKREAVFFRVDGTYAVRYICKCCLETWI